MTGKKPVGIPVDGGVITIEPSVSIARFWLRETIFNLVNPGHYGRRYWTPLYIVIWNIDRTQELYREGPYKDEERNRRMAQVRSQIDRDGLEQFLYEQRS